ncbi:MAG TPA: rod shape-determining protein MreC [Gemmatimonadaceae bacterium]|nr:rod shape-determining protein MreC [Gemmatimonadaceae bacterium]
MARTTVAQGSRIDAAVTVVLAAAALIALALPADYRGPMAAAVRSSVGVPLLALQARAERTRAAFLAHDSTNRVIDSLAMEAVDARALRAENAHLRDLLGLAARLQWGFIASGTDFIPAEAFGERGIGRRVTLTLDAGSQAGIATYAPVIAPSGLVGRVRAVDPTSSIVELFSHENFRVSAMTADQRVVGIVQAHHGDLDEDEYLLEMKDVPFRNVLKPGTLIYTSGLGGTMPSYIPVGTVIRELGTSELWARTYLLRPAVRPGEIRSVLVLLPARAEAGVEGVWASSPDSAARAAAAAGDSLRALQAAADSAARAEALRQRLLDSLRRAGVQLTPAPAAADSAAPAAPVAPAAAPRPAAAPPARPPASPARAGGRDSVPPGRRSVSADDSARPAPTRLRPDTPATASPPPAARPTVPSPPPPGPTAR